MLRIPIVSRYGTVCLLHASRSSCFQLFRSCNRLTRPLCSSRRVERRNFTREPSQIRTRRSPVIRLVPPSEGWRLPPQPQGSSHIRLATIKGSWSGWPVPLAPRALPRFNATTEQSIPDVSIATFRLGGLSPCTFSLNISRQVLTFPSEA